MATRKANPRTAALTAIKKKYGTFLSDVNPATGKRSVVKPQAAFTRMFNNPESPNYRPTSENAYGQTPFALGGVRIGKFNNRTGAFKLAGKAGGLGAKAGAKKRRGKPKGTGGAGGEDSFGVGPSETGRTGLAKAYGSSPTRGQFGAGGKEGAIYTGQKKAKAAKAVKVKPRAKAKARAKTRKKK